MRKHVVVILCICIAVFLAYSNSLNGTWAMDDFVANRPVGIHDLQDLAGFRKISSFTFLINQWIAPFSPASFRLFNILIHLLNVLLVYVIAYRTTGLWKSRSQNETPDDTYQRDPSSQALSVALLSSVVFALHPMNINAVAYIVQRMSSLSTFFILFSLLSYISAYHSPTRVKAVFFYCVCGVGIVAGIFSKENGVMAIPLILLYDYVFLSAFHMKRFLQKLSIMTVICIASFGVALYFLNLHRMLYEVIGLLLKPGQPLTIRDWTAVDVFWTPAQHILTEFRVLSRYLVLLILPLPQFLAFDRWGYQVSENMADPVTTLPSVVLIVSAVLLSLVKLRQYPFLCFGVLWYFIAISLESFFALGSDLYFEHRNYLPLSGLAIGTAGHIITAHGGRLNIQKICMAAVCLGIILGSLTFARNFVWKDSLTLWADTLRKNPSNLRAMMSLGNAHLKLSDMESAERYYRDVSEASRKDKREYFLIESLYSLGMIYLQQREFRKAQDIIAQYPSTSSSYRIGILRGFYKALSGDVKGALNEYSSILNSTKGTHRAVAFTLMGDAFRKEGLPEKAVRHYEKALSVNPQFASAHYGIGAVYRGKGEIAAALGHFKKTLEFDPYHALALSDIADIYLMFESRADEAYIYARKAIEKSPPFYQPYLTMGNTLLVIGKEKEAERYYETSLKHGAPDYMIPFSKARALFKKGNRTKALSFLSELRGYENVPDTIRKLTHMNQEDTAGKN